MKNFNKEKLRVGLLADGFLRTLFKPIKSTSEKTERILIFDFHLLGDIVLLTALLKSVRKKFVNQTIVLSAGPWAKPVLENNPNLYDEFVEFTAPWVKKQYSIKTIWEIGKLVCKLKKMSFDLGIEVRGDLRQLVLMRLSAVKRIVGYAFTGGAYIITDPVPDDGKTKHILDHHKQIAGYLKCQTSDFLPEIWLSDAEKKEVNQERSIRSKKLIGIHPGASLLLRLLPSRTWISVIQKLKCRGNVDLILFKGPGDDEIVSKIQSGVLDYIEVVSVPLRNYLIKIASCDLIVSLDSGCGHLASALGIPVVSIFGPAESSFCKPMGKLVNIVEVPNSEVPCRPCDQKNCVHEQYRYCMVEITVKQILDKVEDLL
jgi:heptosyltransferase II